MLEGVCSLQASSLLPLPPSTVWCWLRREREPGRLHGGICVCKDMAGSDGGVREGVGVRGN